jgi:hypothetical protein
VITRGFNFPAELPEDIATLPRHQGVEYSHMYHAAMINSILMSVEAEREESGALEPVTPAPSAPLPPTPVPSKPAPSTPVAMPHVPVNETQGRVLDAAMAAQIPIGKPAELMAMIRLSTSGGLKGVLRIEESDARPEDVRSRPFELEFPMDADGKAVAAEVTLQINAPDFDPPLQRKVLRVPPKADSPTYSFLLIPKFEGELRINLELCRGDVCLVSRSMRTTGTSSDRASSAKVLVSLPIEVKAARTASPPAPLPSPALPPTQPAPTRAASPFEGMDEMILEDLPSAQTVTHRPASPSYSPSAAPSPAAISRQESSSYTRADAEPSVSSSGPRTRGRAEGEATAAALAKLFGVERSDFQRTRALAFSLAWIAGLFIPQIAMALHRGESQGLSSLVSWILDLAVGVIAILGALWFVRKLAWAGLAAGFAGALGLVLLDALRIYRGFEFSWFLFLRIAELLQYAVFVWILGWVALRKNSRWQYLFLGTFAAYLLSSFFYAVVFGNQGGWQKDWLKEVQPFLDFIGAAIFTAVFQFMTMSRKKSR